MIRYTDSTDSVTPTMLRGFFDGWPTQPSPKTHLRLLRNSGHVVLAIDDGTTRVIGFISAITDGVLAAYIPLLEVLPDYRGRGIGKELVTRMLRKLRNLYMVDLVCDPELQPFYEQCGMRKMTAMMLRNLDGQAGIVV